MHKAQRAPKLKNDPPRQMPHRYVQSLIDASAKIYARHMKAMLREIEDVLSE